MPNFKTFQDDPDKLRIKIYGQGNVAISQDQSGNLGITSTGLMVTTGSGELDVCLGTGSLPITTGSGELDVCLGTGSLPITSSGLMITTGSGELDVCIGTGSLPITTGSGELDVCLGTGSLPITSSGLMITTGSGELDVCLGTGDVTVTSSGLMVTTGSGQLDVNIDSVATIDLTEQLANKASTTSSGTTNRTVLGQNAWTFTVKNDALAENAQAVVQLQMSATALTEADWWQEGATVTLNQNSVDYLTSSLLVKYARIMYKAVSAASAVTLTISFQAQT